MAINSTKAEANERENTFEAIIPGISQSVAVGAASVQSAALQSKSSIIRLFSTTDCFILIGATPTALQDGTSMFLPAGVIEYFGVNGAPLVAVIQSSASGTLYITEGF